MSKVTVSCDKNSISVLINDIPHLYINKDKLMGLQSWYRPKRILGIKVYTVYYINYTIEGSKDILSIYTNKDIWKTILTKLKDE